MEVKDFYMSPLGRAKDTAFCTLNMRRGKNRPFPQGSARFIQILQDMINWN